jgi:hypothetical protein
MAILPATGYSLVAIVVLSLFVFAHWSAKNNLPPTMRDALERVMACHGRSGNRTACPGRDRDTRAVHPRGGMHQARCMSVVRVRASGAEPDGQQPDVRTSDE